MTDRLQQERINAEMQKLQKSVKQGGMSRRSFIAAAMAMGVGAAIPSLYSEAARAAMKKGGRMRVGLTGGATSDILDPGQILDLYMLSLQFGQLRNGLTEVAANGELIPELAESWEASKDARTWNFKLRSGVEFSNGKSLTVEDIVDSLNHHLTEDSKSAAKAILAGVDSIKADGKSNVVVQLKGGDADFPFLLSDYHIGICPSKGDGTIDWESGIGTGGYVLKEHEPGVRSLTTRNPNYWKENSAFFDEIEQLQIADASTRGNALRTGSLDAMNNVEVKTVERMKKIPGINVRATTGNKQATLPMRTDTAPFDNVDVRTAVKLSVDREQWLQKVIRGYGELGNDNPIGPANIYRATTDELPQRAYDPEKAKFHLKKAGHDKLKIQFHAANTGFTGAVDAAQLLRETAAVSGLDVEVVREPEDGYWSNVWMKKPFVACYWSGRATENWMFSQVYAADAKWNDTFWTHEKFNKLLLEARAELEPTKRREMYVEMQQILHNDGGLCLPLFQSDVMAYTDKVNVPETVGNNWELDGGKFADRWSFA